MPAGSNRGLEIAVLLGAVAALLAPGWIGVGLLAVFGSLWLWQWAAGPIERLGVGGLLLAGVALLGLTVLEHDRSLDPERMRTEIHRQFSVLWGELDAAAERAAEAFGSQAPEASAFDTLIEQGRTPAGSHLTYLLIEPDGTPVAWAGPGLLHEIEEQILPPRGRAFRLGFESVTLFSVADLPQPGVERRIVVGRSLNKRDLPLRSDLLGPIRWTVFRPGDVVPAELVEIDLGAGPIVAVESWTERPPVIDPWAPSKRRWGAAAVGLALILLSLLRAARGGGLESSLLAMGGASALALAAQLNLATGTLLVVVFGLAVLGWSRIPGLPRWMPPAIAGAVGTLVTLAAAFAAQRSETGLIDLGSAVFPGELELGWRLILFALAVAWLGQIRGARAARVADGRSSRWAWSALALLLLAGVLHDASRLALTALLLAGGIASAVWVSRQSTSWRPATAAVVCILAGLVASVSGEAAYRENLKYHLNSEVLPSLARPTPSELEYFRQRLEMHFSELDLDSLVLPNPAGLDPQDLGISIWRDSPLAVRGALSAVTARPFGGIHSSFSFGLPLTNEGDVDWTPTRWRKVEEPSPEGSVLSGQTHFLHGGRQWAELSYTLLMRPGFELGRNPIGNLAAGLLRGGPGPFRPAPELIEPALYGLYSPDGDAIEAAWPSVELPLGDLLDTPGTVVAVPEGRAVGFAASGSDGVRVLLLPILGPIAALERVGTHSVSVLLLVGALALVGTALSIRALPAFGAVLRSYSKRMLVVSGLLLPVPILLLNVFALGVLADQLRQEQRQAGELALRSGQRVLGEYILALDPGFGIDTILDDELLSWLSRVVHHEINLYWGSKVYASSKSELFSAGLLPKRIPGEIYSDLAPGGARIASRVNQAGRIDYLELYAPLTIPGEGSGPSRLFLSVPLLAQEAETAERLASLRRRVLLATAALVLLLAAVGGRLVRGFTEPLMEIVDGTQRIAAGATSIELNPADEELATLVQAIDRMAGKISEGRQKLVREKALVERVIDNVNSGVVSLDDERRVVLLNQVARELLRAEVGDDLAEALERDERMVPVAEFLQASASEPRFSTVQLPDEEGEEEEWTLVWVPLPGEGEPTALFVVEDVTEVLRGQRLQAWAEMARIIAHEIKNPLTPIRLSTEHLREVWSERPDEFNRVFDRCTANILEQVDELQQISSEFSAYSRLPKIEPREGDLGEVVRRIVDGYRASDPKCIRLELDPRLGELTTRFDAKLIGRALRNLIENALRASSNGERVQVWVEGGEDRASIRVLDSGPGVNPDVLPRIFDPYFSTHDSGTGLGLPIARRIAEEHGGGVHARNRPEGGLEVELWIPAGSES